MLFFVIFMVDLAVTKLFHPRKLIPRLCESMMMGAATNIVPVRPTLSSVSKQQYSSHCHPADSIFDTNNIILLSHVICPKSL